jgi:uncharacterized protein
MTTMATKDQAASEIFHAGETSIQQRLGVREKIEDLGRRVVRDHMPDQHRSFFAQLPFLLIGALDSDRRPWATVLAGPPGFVRSPDPRTLIIDARPSSTDPLAEALVPGASIGLLGIEPHTRRRNRMNGVLQERSGSGLHVAVSQSFGNCPKYIQARRAEYVETVAREAQVRRGSVLDGEHRERVRRADTFYIATAHPNADHGAARSEGIDVSHRGGKRGFVRVDGEGSRLTIPDFVGNDLFNSLGNLQLNPKCGLLFLDFSSGGLLHVSARGTVVWDGPEVDAFEGAQRLVQFEVEEWRWVDGVLPLRWGPEELSPFLEKTGTWTAEDVRLEGADA